MAKNEEKQSNKIKNFFGFLKNEKFRIIFGLFLIFFTLYLFAAFIFFLFTWKQDLSAFDLGLWDFFSRTTVIANPMGKLGAYLAKVFIYKWFGIAAFGFLIIFPVWGLKLLKINIKNAGFIISRTLMAIVWLSLFLAFVFGNSYFNLGGAYGYIIVDWLSSLIGKFGTFFLLFIYFLTFLFITFEKTFEWSKHFINELSHTSFKDAFKKASENLKKSVSADNSNEIEPADNEEEEEDDDRILTLEDILKDESAENQKVKKKNFILEEDDDDDIDMEIEIKEEQKDLYTTKTIEHNNGLEVETTENIKGDLEQMEDYDPTKTLSHFKLPPLSLLKDHEADNVKVTKEELLENKRTIVNTLKNYKIEVKKVKATVGPTVTLYEIIPAPGVRISKIKNLEADIALSLKALGIRIIAPIPGKGTIGIEVPNKNPGIVSIKSVLSTKAFQESDYELPVALGRDISNEVFVFDLTKMPHLLIAGATGQGKSVGINVILTALLYKKHPAQLKFVLIDPKKVELSLYSRLEKHYLAKLPTYDKPIITDVKKAVEVLNSLTIEMDERYKLLEMAKVRNVKEYNKRFIQRRLNPQKGHRYLPYIVVVIDEFADLIMTAGKEVEMPLARLAQLARAIGIHLIVATQRPSTNIITGVIKANFPARIAFRVSSMIDSRTILDSPGANQLIGRGDMLLSTGGTELKRLQCAFIDTDEIEAVTEFIEGQQGFPEPFELPEPQLEDTETESKNIDLSKRDPLFEDAARLIVNAQQGSTSLIQRKLSIGFNRAGRIMDQLEAAGIVGPAQGSKPREVYFQDIISLEDYLDSLRERS